MARCGFRVGTDALPSRVGEGRGPGYVAALEHGLAVEAEDGVLDGGRAVAVEAGEDRLRKGAAALPRHLAREHPVHDSHHGRRIGAQRQQPFGEAPIRGDDLPLENVIHILSRHAQKAELESSSSAKHNLM